MTSYGRLLLSQTVHLSKKLHLSMVCRVQLYRIGSEIHGDSQPLGKNWVQSFIKRNPSAMVQAPRLLRAVTNCSGRNIAIPEIMAIKASNRYNMDETGILEGRGSNGLVLGSSETRSIRKKEPGSRAWTSLIECISATGKALPPLVIYKGKSVQQQWFPLDLTPYESWKFTATENGWTSVLRPDMQE
ncbi:hypothetical protein CGGC5_v015994 [Colletotrichum fructicola Nara gc5]|uniref:DDE-1 domain-containing protein n=1 Tax=Colletotrichum fructicola (strain Nara gc5) TaxID=1213859 RepID=A0A7J6II51_COLFN|nr:hypothetical protein CGGC5_v015994 [Colletotrichum fructicola Nara gc5]